MTGRVDLSRTTDAPRRARRHRATQAADAEGGPHTGGDLGAPRPSRQPGSLALAAVVGVLLTGLALGAALLLPRSQGAASAQPAVAGAAVLAKAAVDGSATGSPSATSSRVTITAPNRAASRATAAAQRATKLEDKITKLVNKERAKAGCAVVHTDKRLRTAAQGHSADMAAQGYFSHTGKDGSTFVDREVRAGYPRQATGGENVAMGYPKPADVMSGWMNSQGHRGNILTCDFKALGVGLAYDSKGAAYWTQDFGTA